MGPDQFGWNANVVEPEAGERGQVGVGSRVEPGGDQADDSDRPLLPGPRLEQLLLAGEGGDIGLLV